MSETDYEFYDDEKKVYIMMINNSSNINKTHNYLSS